MDVYFQPHEFTKIRSAEAGTIEIDLDNLLIHIEGFPLFRLDCVPPSKRFLDDIGFDSYGHRAFTNRTPKKYRYKWKSASPQVEDEMVELVVRYTNGTPPKPIHDILGLYESPSTGERVRIRLLEMLIGNYMARSPVGYGVRQLEKCATRDDIPDMLLALASSFMFCATSPVMYTKSGVSFEETVKLSRDFTWLRTNMCVLMSTHLDDPRNFQASIVQLASHIMSNSQVDGPVYGIAFSIFHCAIVYIDKRTSTFSYTPVLQFLPSFYAKSPSTPGITALARLGYTPDPSLRDFAKARQLVLKRWQEDNRDEPDFVSRFLELKKVLNTEPTTTSLYGRLPAEVVRNIATYLTDMKDLVYFSLVSRETFYAAVVVLRAPHIEEYRLIECMSMYIKRWLMGRDLIARLCQAQFKAVDRQGDIVVLKIGMGVGWEQRIELPFIDGPWEQSTSVEYRLVTAVDEVIDYDENSDVTDSESDASDL